MKMEDDSRYEVVGEIARGGMGVVLLVKDIDLDRNLAMKRMAIAPDATAGASEVGRFARFMEEAQVTAQLDHPSIVPVHELGFDEDGTGWYTMKLVDGRELGEIIQLAREGREDWTMARVLGVLVQVCQALVYAHQKGVVHRDLKPANIMVGNLGEVYVMDWGLAKVEGSELTSPRDAGEDSQERSGVLMTLDGSVMGTPEYMSPEQARGDTAQVGPQSDVYAIGAMLYELLSGRPPFQGSSRDVVKQVASEKPTALGKEVSSELAAICYKAMEANLDDRYSSARPLLDDLRRSLDGRVVTAHESGSWAEARKWVGRNRGLTVGAGAFLLTLISLLALQWLARQRIGESLEKEGEARVEAIRAVEKMSVSQALSAGVHGEQGKSAYWFQEAARLSDDPSRAEVHQVRASLALSRASLPWRALMVPPEVHGRIDFGPRGRFLVIEHRLRGRVFQVMDVAAEALVTGPDGSSWCRAAGVCPESGRLAFAPEGQEGLVVILHGESLQEEFRFQVPGEVGAVAFHPDGRKLVVASGDGYVFDLEAGRLTEQVFRHADQRRIGRVVFDRDGRRLLTVTNRVSRPGYGDDLVQLRVFAWEGDGTSLFEPLEQWFWPNLGQPKFVGNGDSFIYQPGVNETAVCLSATGKRSARFDTGFGDYSSNGEFAASSGIVSEVASGRQLASGAFGNARFCLPRDSFFATRPQLRELSLSGGGELQKFGLGSERTQEIAVSPDGRFLAGWEESGLVRVWKLQQFTWTMPAAERGEVRLSPDGRLVVNAGRAICGELAPSTRFTVRAVDGGQTMGSEVTLPAHLCDADFSPAEDLLATGLDSQEVIFWNWVTGEQVGNPVSLPSRPACLRWSPDGQALAVMCHDGRLFELRRSGGGFAAQFLAAGREVRSEVEAYESLKGMAYSPNGRWLAAWSLCEGILLWDCEKGELAKSPSCESLFVNSVTVGNEGLRYLDTIWEKQFFEIRDWGYELGKARKAPIVLPQGRYFAMHSQPEGGRLILSDRYHEWSLLVEDRPTGGASFRKLRKTSQLRSFLLPHSPWVAGVGSGTGEQLIFVDSRDETLLASPWDGEGTYFPYAVISTTGNAIAAVNWSAQGGGEAFIWNPRLATAQANRGGRTASFHHRLAALNAGGMSRSGEWTVWSSDEWLQHWEEFREDFPEGHPYHECLPTFQMEKKS